MPDAPSPLSLASMPLPTSTSPILSTKTLAARPTPVSSTLSSKYIVVVRDEEFVLHKSQIEFDAPNYFTAYLFGDFAEGGSTTLHVDRNPELFAIIVEYLSGYTILPLAVKALPRTMDSRTALINLVDDAAFYGLTRLHTLLTTPRQPTIDFSWTGFSGRVVSFDDVLRGRLPESVSYTTSGLCSFDGGMVRPVIIWARDIALKLIGKCDFENIGRASSIESVADFCLCLTPEATAMLKAQPYAFEYYEYDSQALVVSVLPESRLRINGALCRFEHFVHWWRARRTPGVHTGFGGSSGQPRIDAREAERVFDDAFPLRLGESSSRGLDNFEFPLWGDELMFVITARGFIAGTLQLHVKLLDVRARTRAAILDTLRPPYLMES